MNQNLIALAFRGVDHETLVNNLLSMQPEYWLAERILGGISPVTLDAVKRYYERYYDHKTPTSIEMKSGFDHDNVRVNYEYTEDCWCTLPADHVLSKNEWKAFQKLEGFSSSYSKSEKCCHRVQYTRDGWSSHACEDFQPFEEVHYELSA